MWDKIYAALNKLATSKINWTQYVALGVMAYTLITHRPVDTDTQAQLAAKLNDLVVSVAGIAATVHGLTITLRTFFNNPKPKVVAPSAPASDATPKT